jgi:predicted DNA-binding transcriptional regulator AlpA
LPFCADLHFRMRPGMASKDKLPPIPPALADVAMIDGPSCASSFGLSLSAWHELVRRREMPQPVIRKPRCTRWLLSDIRAALIDRASEQSVEDATAVTELAKRASSAARRPEAIEKARATRAANAKNKPKPSSAGDTTGA